MRKITILTALTAILLCANANAQNLQNQGGFTGPTVGAMTVAEAKNLSDDTPVILKGTIEKSLGGEKYSFKDATGSVIIEIDNEDWRGLSVNANDVIEIHGEVDKDFTKFEIDVDRVVKAN